MFEFFIKPISIDWLCFFFAFRRLSKSQQHLTDSFDHRCHNNDNDSNNRDELNYPYSRSVCGSYSLPPPLHLTLSDPFAYKNRGLRFGSLAQQNPEDRLNILKWPESPRRYRSVQDLNSVGGLVEVVEDGNWPLEGNRSVDCIYTQVW